MTVVQILPMNKKKISLSTHFLSPVSSLPSTETIFMQLEPSLLAAACISSASRGLNVSTKMATGYDLCRLTSHDLVKVDFIVKIIEEIVAKEIADKQLQQQQQQMGASGGSCKEQYQQVPQKVSPAGASVEQASVQQQPETPTDVQFIYF